MTLWRAWILWYSILLHLSWGLALLIDEAPQRLPSIAPVALWLPGPVLGPAFLGVGLLALAGTLRSRGLLSLGLLLPQQFTLIVSAWGAYFAIHKGQFPDGLVQPRAFLLCNQLPSFLIVVLHTLALLDHHAAELEKWLCTRWRQRRWNRG